MPPPKIPPSRRRKRRSRRSSAVRRVSEPSAARSRARMAGAGCGGGTAVAGVEPTAGAPRDAAASAPFAGMLRGSPPVVTPSTVLFVPLPVLIGPPRSRTAPTRPVRYTHCEEESGAQSVSKERRSRLVANRSGRDWVGRARQWSLDGPDPPDREAPPRAMETAFPWPVRCAAVVAGVVVGWTWRDSGIGRQAAAGLQYGAMVAVAVAASCWVYAFATNATLALLWLLPTFSERTAIDLGISRHL